MSVNEGRIKDRLLNIYFEYTETRDELVPRQALDDMVNEVRDSLLNLTCDPCPNFSTGDCSLARPIEDSSCLLRQKISEWFVWYDETVIPIP